MESDVLIAAAVAATILAVAGWALWASRRRAAAEPATQRIESGRQTGADLASRLAKTRAGLLSRLLAAWSAGGAADDRSIPIEEALLAADVGAKATQELLAGLRTVLDRGNVEALQEGLHREMLSILAQTPAPHVQEIKPHVILVAGVNGVGKTTSIGKLAHLYRAAGKKVLLVAADTFRAAAAEQLVLWGDRVGAECVHHQAGADPSAVAYDGVSAGVARGSDVVIVDTAGRLHVKQHLIEELKKIARVIGRQVEGAPHEVLLVLDATTGQNALAQARVFQEALPLTGIILAKLDGTAKGGVVFAIRKELGIPVRYIGVGEGVDDLRPFDPRAFVDALLADPS